MSGNEVGREKPPARLPVTIDIEYHNTNSFHTSYNSAKYLELARRLEFNLKDCLATERVKHLVRLNPGLGKGYERAGGTRLGWFKSTKDGSFKQYPRLGSFEVVVSCPSGFVPQSAGLPPLLSVWSKIASRRWPDPEELAQSVVELLTAARNGETVSDMVQAFNGLCAANNNKGHHAPNAPRAPLSKTPMFFGRAERTNLPGVVEIRKTRAEQFAEEEKEKGNASVAKSFSIPRRPASAGAGRSSAATVTPGRIRPISAGHIRSSLTQASKDLEVKLGIVSCAESPVPKKDELPSEYSLDEHRPQLFLSQQASDGIFDPDSPTPKSPSTREQLHQLESSASATDTMLARPELEELTRILLSEYGSSVDLDTLVEGDVDAMLDVNGFKEKLYSLRIINSPFNYIGLFKEICTNTKKGPRASLANLLDCISDCWPTPAVRSAKKAAPAVRQIPPPPPPKPGSIPLPAPLAKAASASHPVSPALLLFRDLDRNGDGRVSRHELKTKLAKDKDIQTLLGMQDVGVGDRSQLMYRLWEVRKKLDADGDGYISQDELVQLFQAQDAKLEKPGVPPGAAAVDGKKSANGDRPMGYGPDYGDDVFEDEPKPSRPESQLAGCPPQATSPKSPTSPGFAPCLNGSVQSQHMQPPSTAKDPYNEGFESDDNEAIPVQEDPVRHGQHYFNYEQDEYDDIVADRVLEDGEEFDYAEDVEVGSEDEYDEFEDDV